MGARLRPWLAWALLGGAGGLLLLVLLLSASGPAAAWSSPGTGITYTMASLDAATGEIDSLAGPPTCHFRVDNTVTISAGDTLIIDAGCKLDFDNNEYILMYGHLFVNGSAALPVVFDSNTGSPSSGAYGGLQFLGAGTSPSRIDNLSITWAERALRCSGCQGLSVHNLTGTSYSLDFLYIAGGASQVDLQDIRAVVTSFTSQSVLIMLGSSHITGRNITGNQAAVDLLSWNCSDIRLDGPLWVASASYGTAWVDNTTNITLTGLSGQGHPFGLHVTNSQQVAASGLNYTGVAQPPARFIRVQNLTLSSVLVRGSLSDAVLLDNVTGATLTGLDLNATEAGLRMVSVANVTVDGLAASGTKVGLWATRCQSLDVAAAAIANSTKVGLVVESCGPFTLSSSSVWGSAGDGALLTNVTNASLDGVQLAGNGGSGGSFTGVGPLRLASLNASGNGRAGLLLSQAVANVSSVWASSNAQAGIVLSNASEVTGTDVTVDANGADGLVLGGGTRATLAGLVAAGGGANGTRVDGTAVLTLSGGRFENNTLLGLNVQPGATAWWTVDRPDESIIGNGALLAGTLNGTAGGTLRIEDATVSLRAAPTEVFVVNFTGPSSLRLANATLERANASSSFVVSLGPGALLDATGSTLSHAGGGTSLPALGARSATLRLASTALVAAGGGIRLNASGATLVGVNMTGGTGGALWAQAASSVAVDGLRVTGLVDGVAVRLEGASTLQGAGLFLTSTPAAAVNLSGGSLLDIDRFNASSLDSCVVCVTGASTVFVRNGTLSTAGPDPAIGPGPAAGVRLYDTQLAAVSAPGILVNTSGFLELLGDRIISWGPAVESTGGSWIIVRNSTLQSTAGEAFRADAPSRMDVWDSAFAGTTGGLRAEGALFADVHQSQLDTVSGTALRVAGSGIVRLSACNVTAGPGALGAEFENNVFNATGLDVLAGANATGVRVVGGGGSVLASFRVGVADGSVGVHTEDSIGLRIQDGSVTAGNASVGVSVSGATGLLSNLTVTAGDNATGLDMDGAFASQWSLVRVTVGAGSVGVASNGSTGLQAQNTTVTAGPGSWGLLLAGPFGSTFSWLTVEGGALGLQSTGNGQGLTLRNASFSNQTGVALSVSDALGLQLVDVAAAPAPLELSNTTGARLTRVTVRDTPSVALTVSLSDSVVVEDSLLAPAAGSGLVAVSGGPLTLLRLSVEGGDEGVRLTDVFAATATDLSVVGAATGVRVTGDSLVVLQDPRLEGASADVVNATDGSSLDVFRGAIAGTGPGARHASASGRALVRLYDTPADNSTFTVTGGGTVEVYWSLTLSATVSGAPAPSVDIALAGRSGSGAGAATTGPNGTAAPLTLMELRKTASSVTYTSPYTANATATGGFEGSVSFDLDRARTVVVALVDVAPPTLASRAGLRVSVNDTVTFAPLAGDDDNVGIASYTWAFENETGAPVTLGSPSGTYAFAVPGHYAVRVTATDAAGNRANTTYDVWVNAAPYFTVLPTMMDLTATVGSPFAFTVGATDPDPEDVPGLRISVQSSVGMSMSGSRLEWTPTAGGLYLFTLRVTDGLDIDTATFQLLVEEPMGPSNLPPVFLTPPRLDANILSPYAYNVQVEDPEDDVVLVQLMSAPTGMTLVQAPGSYRAELAWEPGLYFKRGAEAFNFTFDVVLRASDGHSSVWQNFTVLLRNPPDQPPVIDEISLHPLGPGETVTIDLRQFGTDPDDDPSTLVWSLEATGETHGTSVYLNPNNPNELIVRAPDAWPGDQSFLVTLVLTDTSGISNRSAVQIQLKAPSAIDTAFPWLLLIALIAVAGGAYALATRSRAGLLPPSETPATPPPATGEGAPAAAAGSGDAATSPLHIEAVALLDTSDQVLRHLQAEGADAEGTVVLVPAALRGAPLGVDHVHTARVEGHDVAAVQLGEGILVAVGSFAGEPGPWLLEPMSRALRRIHERAHAAGAEGLEDIADTEDVSQALAPVLGLAGSSTAAAVEAYRSSKAVKVASTAELVGGELLLRVGVENGTDAAAHDVRLSLEYNDRAARLEAKDPPADASRDKVAVGTLRPGQLQTVSFTFDPQVCGRLQFHATATFEDGKGGFHKAAMPARVVEEACPPFSTAFAPSTGMLKRLVRTELATRDARFFRFPEGSTADAVFERAKAAVSGLGLSLLRERTGERVPTLEAWFHGETGSPPQRVVVWTTVARDDGVVQVTVAAAGPAVVEELLARFGRDLSGGTGKAAAQALTSEEEEQARRKRSDLFSQQQEGELSPEDG